MPIDYVVRQGDCISSIAFSHGHFWQTIWNHPNNSQLKTSRKDPNILFEGDIVHIPDLEERTEQASTEKRHTYVMKGVPARLRMQLFEEVEDPPPESSAGSSNDMSVHQDPSHDPARRRDQPRANVEYVLEIDGRSIRGTTDGEGRIDQPLPPNAVRGTLTIAPGTERESVLQLTLGAMDPVTEIIGVCKRLNHLGFYGGDANEMTPELQAALRAFQEKYGLEATGEADQATRDKLLQVHGS
jgi:hypothetical protein